MPEDASGDWFYHVMEGLGALITIVMILLVWQSSRYDSEFDTAKSYYIAAIAFVAALIIRPSISRRTWLNFCWIFAFYIETFAIIPQLMLFVKKVFLCVCIFLGW